MINLTTKFYFWNNFRLNFENDQWYVSRDNFKISTEQPQTPRDLYNEDITITANCATTFSRTDFTRRNEYSMSTCKKIHNPIFDKCTYSGRKIHTMNTINTQRPLSYDCHIKYLFITGHTFTTPL